MIDKKLDATTTSTQNSTKEASYKSSPGEPFYKNPTREVIYTDQSLFPLNLLLFSAGIFSLASDAAQIKRIDSPLYGCSSIIKRDIIIDSGDGDEYRVGIYAVEDIITVDRQDILPFPATIAKWAIKLGMWAVMFRNQRVYTLLDLRHLISSLPDNQLPLSVDKPQYTLLNGYLTITAIPCRHNEL